MGAMTPTRLLPLLLLCFTLPASAQDRVPPPKLSEALKAQIAEAQRIAREWLEKHQQ